MMGFVKTNMKKYMYTNHKKVVSKWSGEGGGDRGRLQKNPMCLRNDMK